MLFNLGERYLPKTLKMKPMGYNQNILSFIITWYQSSYHDSFDIEYQISISSGEKQNYSSATSHRSINLYFNEHLHYIINISICASSTQFLLGTENIAHIFLPFYMI